MKASTPRATAPLTLALLGALTLSPIPSLAQAKGGKAEMLRLSAQGDEAYSQSRFREAAALFERAWTAQPDPILLKNQAISWFQVYTTERKAGSTTAAQRETCASATSAAKRFITESNELGELKLEDQRLVNTIMVQCYQDMASLDIKEDKLDDANVNIKAAAALGLKEGDLVRNDALRDEIERRRMAAAAPDKNDDGTIVDPAMPDTPQPKAEGSSVLGWTLVGIGAAGFLGAGGAALYGVGERDEFYEVHFGGRAPSDYNCNTARYPSSCKRDSADMQSAVSTSNVLMFTGLGIGVAGVVAGALLLMGAEEEAERAIISPTFGPDSAGVMMELKF